MRHVLNLDLEKQNTQVINNIFSWSKDFYLRTYYSPELALSECILGISKMLPHKNIVYIREGRSPYTYSLASHFSKQGIKFKAFNTVEDISFEDALCVLAVADQPISGEIFQLDKIKQSSDTNKVFFVSLHHNDFLLPDFVIQKSPYNIHIFAYNHNLAFTALSSRTKKILALSTQNAVATADLKFDFIKENKAKVIQLENEILEKIPAASLYFKQDTHRVFDRILFRLQDTNGEWLLNKLKLRGMTSSPCFWPHPFQLSWWDGLKDEEQWLILYIEQDLDSLLPSLSSLV